MKKRRIIQGIIPLLLLFAFSAEDDFHRQLQTKLDGYYYRNMPVKLNLFFNQPIYAPGDTAFYRIAFFTAQDHELIQGRQIINVNLTDNKGDVIQQQKVLLRNGWGKSQFRLSANLTPGIYTVMAYSDWMRNHPEDLFCFNTILVTKKNRISPKTTDVLPSFYAEGGVLALGLSNKMVALGKPGDQITIVTENNKPVTACTLDRFGIGLFYLTPQQNEKYFGVNQRGSKMALPVAERSPVSMIATPPAPGKPLKITFEKDGTNPTESLYVTITSQRKIYYSAKLSFGDKRHAVVNVPYENLLSGLSLVTVFTGDGRDLLNRMIFVRHFDQSQAMVSIDKTTFTTREKVEVNVQLKDKNGNPVQGNLSVAVQDVTLLPSENKSDNFVHSLTNSDLPFSGIGCPDLEQMDGFTLNNFLITSKWLRFDWKDVTTDKTFDKFSLRENIQFSGRLIHPEGKPFGDSTLVTFFLQRDVMLYQTYAAPDGTFDFPLLFDFEDSDEVYYRVETKRKIVPGVKLEQELMKSPALSLPPWTETGDPSTYGMFAAQLALIESAYQPTRTVESYTFKKRGTLDNIKEEFFESDVQVNLSDYVLFPTMEETFREVVPFVSHRKINHRSMIRVYMSDEKTMSSGDPVYIIDGVMTDDTDYMMSLKPENISKIKIISSQRRMQKFGPIGRYGVIIIETRIPGNFRHVPRSKTMFYATGITTPVLFSSPRPENFQPRIPVLKSCLYWNAHLKTDASGKATFTFYTGDNTGEFRILIDGLSAHGEPVSAEQHFQIQFSKAN